MTIEDPTVASERLREGALDAARRADAARELALDLERRHHAMLTRLERSIALHTEAVWGSPAATRSRGILHDDIAFGVWAAGESLADTRRSLEATAVALDDEARVLGREAAAVLARAIPPVPGEPVF
jgi:hypothetical protein